MEKWVIGLIPAYFVFMTGIGFSMFFRRVHAVKTGEIRLGFFKTNAGDEPERLRVLRNHFSSQFEVPLVFFITCLAAVQLKAADMTTFIIGCIYIASRIVHSYIHLGSNKITRRAAAFMFGFIVLWAMWIHILTV